MTDFRRQWNDTCKAAGIKPITKDTSARLMAVVYKFDNENVTHNTKLMADIRYIQQEYGIMPCETPDKDFCALFAKYVVEIERNNDNPTDWAKELMLNNYNIKL